jgi:hypothetical protein
MKISLSIICSTSFVGIVLADNTQGDIQINIYDNGDDGICTTGYLASFLPYTDGKCYNYSWDGSKACAMVDCIDSGERICAFYDEYDCNCSHAANLRVGDCVDGNWKSVKCNAVCPSEDYWCGGGGSPI